MMTLLLPRFARRLAAASLLLLFAGAAGAAVVIDGYLHVQPLSGTIAAESNGTVGHGSCDLCRLTGSPTAATAEAAMFAAVETPAGQGGPSRVDVATTSFLIPVPRGPPHLPI